MATDTLVRPQVSNVDGDHERFSHYVKKDDKFRGYLLGEEVKALCGKVWVPKKDPKAFPICPTCKSIKETRR